MFGGILYPTLTWLVFLNVTLARQVARIYKSEDLGIDNLDVVSNRCSSESKQNITYHMYSSHNVTGSIYSDHVVTCSILHGDKDGIQCCKLKFEE